MIWGVWGDRRHWELFLGRLRIHRWCAGAPCHLDHAPHARHWIRVHARR